MNTLSYETLAQLGFEGYLLKGAPVRMLQFGEGNFLRAFVDYFVDLANERCGFNAKVLAVQPKGNPIRERFEVQDCLYTLCTRGMENGERVDSRRVISCLAGCVSAGTQFDRVLEAAAEPALRFIVSNTTEAGIVFRPEDRWEAPEQAAFPGKLTRFLHERYRLFQGSRESGFVLLPCELIDDNGAALRHCVEQYIRLWELEESFAAWVRGANLFCSTLVDRIVTGFPADEAQALHRENGYVDGLLDSCEPFGLWVIEGPASLAEELPFAAAGLPVMVTDNHKPYKQRKVRILNGAHTALACVALLCGVETVGQSMADPLLREYVDRAIHREIIPTLDLPQEELLLFARAVQDRFCNPFLRHQLLSIMLNVTSKWRARVLPSVEQYQHRFGGLPPLLVFSFAAYLAFLRDPERLAALSDDQEVLAFFAARGGEEDAALVAAACSNTGFWGRDLRELEGFAGAVREDLTQIRVLGMREALVRRLEEVR